MALSGTITKSISGTLSYEIRWSATQSTSANTSTVTCKHYLTGSGYNLIVAARTLTCTVGGVEKTLTTPSVNGSVTEKLLGTTTHTVTHNSDGTKSVSIKGVYPIAATLSGTYISSVTASQTVTLDTIPRASSVSCGTGYIGGSATISIKKASTDFTHTLTYVFGDLSGTIVTKTSASSYSWTIPDSFAAEMGSLTNKSGTITCTTYSGSTSVGTSTCTFYVRTSAANNAPTLNPSVYDSNSTTSALTGNTLTFIKYFSNATYSIGATAASGATITSQSVTCGNRSSTASSGTFSNVEDATFVFSATDSRKYTTTETITGTLIDYVRLTCNLKSGNPTVSGQLSITIFGNVFNGSFGKSNNTLTVQYRYKVGDGSYGSWNTVSASMSGNTYSATTTLTGLDYEAHYTFEARAIDSLMTVTSSDKPISSVPLFSWCNNAFVHNTDLYFGQYGSGDGIIYGYYNGDYVGNIQPINEEGNCLVGLGNYLNGYGDTGILAGDSVYCKVDGYDGIPFDVSSSGTTINNGLSVSGGATLSGGTTISNGASVTGGMSVSGTLNANSTLNANAGLSVSGTAWVEGGVRAYNYTINGYELPYVQSGYVTLKTTASSTVSASVTFPKSYTASPDVALGVYTTVPGYTSAGFSGISKSGFTIYLNRTNAATTYVYWVAVGSI